MENAEIKSSSPRKQELSYGKEGVQLSGQTRGSACSLLAGGSKDTEVFSRPKTYAFIFKDLLLGRALFLQGQIPTSAEKLFQAFCKEASGQRGCRAFPPLPTSARVRQMFLACRMNGGLTCFGQEGHIQPPPKAETSTLISPSFTHMKVAKPLQPSASTASSK